MVTGTVLTVLMRRSVDLSVHRSSSDVTMAIVSIKNGVVMVLQIAEIIQMKKVKEAVRQIACR